MSEHSFSSSDIENFRSGLITTVNQSVQSGDLGIVKSLRARRAIRKASPEQLADIMTDVDADYRSRNPEMAGKIDWTAIASFLKEIAPLVLEILAKFGIV